MNIIYKDSKVAFQQVGNGQDLVLLHGFCEDSTMWADFVNELSKKYKILTIDLSGFGESDLLPEHSIDAMADAVYAVIAHLGLQNLVLIGHSMGGYVCLSFAEKYGTRLAGLGLFHSHPFVDSDIKIENRKKTVRFVERHGVAPFAAQFVRNLVTPSFFQQNTVLIDDLIHKINTHHSDAVIAASEAMINRADKASVLANIACPVLFIIGKEDGAISMEDSLRQLSLPTVASVHILEGVGHLAMVEAREESLRIVEEFMKLVITETGGLKPTFAK